MFNQYARNGTKSASMSIFGSAMFSIGIPLVLLGIIPLVCGISAFIPHVFGGSILLFFGAYMLRHCDGGKGTAVLAMCVAFISFWVGVFIAVRLVIHVPIFQMIM